MKFLNQILTKNEIFKTEDNVPARNLQEKNIFGIPKVRYESEDSDPHQNVSDPQHRFQKYLRI
jgi:hypothetical protein